MLNKGKLPHLEVTPTRLPLPPEHAALSITKALYLDIFHDNREKLAEELLPTNKQMLHRQANRLKRYLHLL